MLKLPGDLFGPSSSTDNALLRFDGTSGKITQNSSATLSDAGVLSVAGAAVSGTDGIDFSPGSDVDCDLLTVGVTGSPRMYWDESIDRFRMTKGLTVDAQLYVTQDLYCTDDLILSVNNQSGVHARTSGGSLPAVLFLNGSDELLMGDSSDTDIRMSVVDFWRVYRGADEKLRLDADGLEVDDVLTVSDTTASTSPTTGSLVNDGGFGNAGAAHIGGDIDCDGALLMAATQVVTTRQTGWAAPTGTATRTTFDPSTVTLAQLGERVHALIDDLTTHGLIGT